MKAVLRAFALLVAIALVVAATAGYALVYRGLSTRIPPSAAEALVAAGLRRLATTAAVRDRPNPISASEAVVADGLEHFADHCASCHGNDGSGTTSLGRSFYPPAPDMRATATQQLTDGELFSIIENGIRLTGMPAWGTGTVEGERGSWALVHFMRRLPGLTAEELARMEALNPRTPDEFRQQEEARRFLAGEDVAAPAVTPGRHAAHQ